MDLILNLIVLLLVFVLIILFLKYLKLKDEIERRALSLFEEWRSTELKKEVEEKAKILFSEWKQKEEKNIRRDAIKRSEAVVMGKITEHLVPYFPEFKYNPKDARFVGSPVDFIVFDGLSEDNLKKIVFIEVKTGKKGTLSHREKLIKKCVEDKNIEYELIHHDYNHNNKNSKIKK
ncbi:Holliday junction resolvase-like protein [Methanothermococcus okinawensis]|uniref:Holliday junction resolvase-like protein n=1 Tax=Methanothermococcus okinawensis (strain DSM 14208 / JCM 11175 / IH1) TaxID=647113 RepID=F8AJU5_METOI|nr:Holliday junction resolvase-like protein [Methanothermococcus okinawensis]AEH07297.1 Holliday junction resolvase-like protein [Methanothermococcus okinawensis IH1]